MRALVGISQVSWGWLLKVTPMHSYTHRGHTLRGLSHTGTSMQRPTHPQDLCPEPEKGPSQEKDTQRAAQVHELSLSATLRPVLHRTL